MEMENMTRKRRHRKKDSQNGPGVARGRIYLYDSTLRDGAQSRGVDFSVTDKRTICKDFDRFGLDYIEGGWPGANPTDDHFFAAPPTLSRARLVAFGMTRRPAVGSLRIRACKPFWPAGRRPFVWWVSPGISRSKWPWASAWTKTGR